MSERVDNRLLARLATPSRRRLADAGMYVQLRRGAVLAVSWDEPRYCWFPCAGRIAVEGVVDSGACVEVLVIGTEGLAGLSNLTIGDGDWGRRLVARSEGRALRIEAARLERLAADDPAITQLLLQSAVVALNRTAQAVVCNRMHALESRLSSWLLDTIDHEADECIAITHDALAQRLGVRREAVSHTLARLKSAGAIDCGRGQLRLLDRADIEARACDCDRARRARSRSPVGAAAAR